MSSFVGLLRFDGAPCEGATLEAMLSSLARRVTPDSTARARVRARGPVGLGCAVLPTTPQARLELQDPDAQQVLALDGGQLWIAGEVRLDNRAQLIGDLKAGGEARTWSDGRLVLAAYARWGEECAARMRGDFGFAIWDGRRNRLFCARDVFGVKPFYYAHAPGQWLAFASEIKALWRVPGADPSVNPRQIADYLVADFRDKTSTFYLEAHRLAPAHWFSLSPTEGALQAIEPQRYWSINGGALALPADPRERDAQCAALVRASFGDSVEQRMRSESGLAVFLSGGLDSSCIAAWAERELDADRKPLTALSTVFERFPSCDERRYINQTLARGSFDSIQMNGDSISPFQDLGRIAWHMDGPSPGPNICSAWAQYRLLQEAGASVVLDGHGGDEIVFKGYERIGQLLRDGQFGTAWREMRLLHRHGVVENRPGLQLWGALLWHARDKRGWGRLTRPLRQRQARRAREADSRGQLEARSLGVLTPHCLELVEAPAPPPGAPLNVRELHRREIEGALQPLALEGIDAMSGAHAIETRCPFWERELAQLCLSLPDDQKLRDGHNRFVMRRAMEGVLAPEVQWRRDKTNFGPQITATLREQSGPQLEAFFADWERAAGTSQLGRYVDLERLQTQWARLQDAPPASLEAALPAIVLWKVFSLGTWLADQAPHATPPHATPPV